MKVGFGLVTCQRNPEDPEGRDDATLYGQALELARTAESAGLDSFWVSEHHFWDDGYLPGSLPLLAAAAAVTERIELATGILLAPLHDPIRLAEDAAVVDLISGGRLILGLGMGWREEEFAGFGLEVGGRVARLQEAIEVLRSSWSEAGLAGPAEVMVTPKPARPGGPPIWLGGFVEPAVQRAARIADGFIASIPPWSGEEWERYSETLAAVERPFEISAHVDVFVWDGPEDPWQLVRDYRWYIDWKYGDAAADHADRVARPPAAAPPAAADLTAGPGRLIGRPEEVLEGLREIGQRVTPGGHLVLKAYYPGIPWEVQRRQVELLGAIAEEL
jgi:alkanesulfonate monooxygenase SsuD/methylene tetrahydromethanopterin reductase-like flavin-dependent oxidoreductase (luciferase family)